MNKTVEIQSITVDSVHPRNDVDPTDNFTRETTCCSDLACCSPLSVKYGSLYLGLSLTVVSPADVTDARYHCPYPDDVRDLPPTDHGE